MEGLGPKKRAPPSRSQKDRRMRRVPRGPIRGPGCQPGGKEAGPRWGRGESLHRRRGVERQFRTESEPARTVQHEASGDDGRPAGGRQTECSRVSGTLTRRAVCWPASRLAGAATGGVRSRESRAAALLQRRSETVEGRMGGQTRAAKGRDRGGGRPDAMALQEGRRTVAADTAGGNS